MKISNETKVGALTSIAIVFLILGFNFLKGKSLFKHGNFIYATFSDAKSLKPSYEVWANGFQVGTVYEVSSSEDLKNVLVTIKLNKDYQIPKNSLASIKESFISSPAVDIALGDNRNEFLKSGDTILSTNMAGILGNIQDKVGPLSDKFTVALGSLDSLLKNINSTIDATTKANLQNAIGNIQRISSAMVVSSQSLQKMMNEQGSLAQSLDNMKAFTANLNTNNDKINAAIGNLQKTSDNIAQSDIKGTITDLKDAVSKLNSALDSKNGSLGLLLNDKQFYNNLVTTSRSANILLDDIRVNPKRYVNLSFSVFGGKKNTTPPLKEPVTLLPDTTRKR
jgi:phospholipid/cholesterol/gamma-HCH transport system substrate-binding protein